MQPWTELLISYIPLAVLGLIIGIGYYLAWRNFRPKRIKTNKSRQNAIQEKARNPQKKRPYTDRELGLQPTIGELATLSYEDQQKHRLEEKIRDLTQNTPDGTAGVIKGWLREA